MANNVKQRSFHITCEGHGSTKENGIMASTLFAWIKKYRESGIDELKCSKPGRPESIENVYLKEEAKAIWLKSKKRYGYLKICIAIVNEYSEKINHKKTLCLMNEMFYNDGQSMMTIREFIPYLKDYLNLFREEKIKKLLGYKSMVDNRKNWDYHFKKSRKTSVAPSRGFGTKENIFD